MLGHVFYTATHFGFVIICFFTGRKKGAVSCLYRTDDRTWHCKFRLDCRTKRKKAKDGPLALLVHIGHCKFRLDCRTKRKAKDGPLALLVHIGHCKFRLDCRTKRKKAKDWPLSATSAHNVR